TCRPPAPRRIFCASLSDAYRASSPDRRGLSAPNIHKRPFNPQTLPAPNSGSKPEPTRCVQTQAKSKEITQKRRPRRRNRQSAALSGLGYSILKSLEPHGFKTAYSENVSDADEAEAMRDYASQGYQIVMGHSGRFVSAMEQVAPDFPKTQFIAVSGNEGKPPNVMSIDWNNAQFGCQLGLLAARMSKTHKVGGVYGLQGVPNITAQAGGFRICATKAGAQVTIIYFKDMEDAAQAKEAELSLIGQGADFITGKLNAAEAGLVQAAKEKNV